MRILVLDGQENQAVAAVRSLARAGHRVVVGSDARWSKAGWSKAASGTFRYPAPQVDTEEFVAAVVREAALESATLVLPMTERTSLPISRERDALFAAGARLVLPPHARVLQAFDKQQTTALAASLDIPTPVTRAVGKDPVVARMVAESVPYPVVLKPRASEEAVGASVRTTGAPMYATTPEEFMESWRALSARCSSVLVQEFVAGTGAGYFAIVRRGEVRAEFAHRRIRDVRPTGSGSAVRESAPLDPILRGHGQAILRALDWHGVAMVEFKRRPDGTAVFLEVNGRFWNSLPLAVYAGADFPRWVAELAEHGDVSGPATYRTGVRSRWILGDVRHLLEVWRGAPRGYRGPFPSRLTATAAFFTPTPGMYHDNFNWRDPLPEFGDWIDFFSRKLPGRLARDKRDGLHASGRPAPS